MSLTIKLKPELEAGLETLAAARGLPLSQFVQKVLEDQLAPSSAPKTLSAAERAAAWRTPVPDRPTRPALSDEAISRDASYNARG